MVTWNYGNDPYAVNDENYYLFLFACIPHISVSIFFIIKGLRYSTPKFAYSENNSIENPIHILKSTCSRALLAHVTFQVQHPNCSRSPTVLMAPLTGEESHKQSQKEATKVTIMPYISGIYNAGGDHCSLSKEGNEAFQEDQTIRITSHLPDALPGFHVLATKQVPFALAHPFPSPQSSWFPCSLAPLSFYSP